MGPLVLLALLVGLGFWLRRLWSRSAVGQSSAALRDWPGPPRQPLVGNSLQLKTGPSLLSQLIESDFTICVFNGWKGKGWYATYGSPMRLSFGPIHGVHVFKAQHVEAVMKCLKNTRKNRDYDFVREWLGDGLLISSGEKWFQRRKLLTPTFHFAILKDFMGVFNAQTHTLARILKERALQAAGQPLDVCPYITRSTLDIICETAMGVSKNAQEDTHSPYAAAIAEFAELTNVRTMRPWLWPDLVWKYVLRHKYGRRWNEILATLHGFTNSVIDGRIEERREAKEKSGEAKVEESDDPFGSAGKRKRRAFLDLLLEMKEEGRLSLEDVREEVDTFMFEGHDTTAHAIMWALYALGRHPDAQQRAREEVAAVMGHRRDIQTEDLAEMAFLDRCLKESQRLWPSVPLIARETDAELQLDAEHTVPPKTGVYVNIFALHRQSEHFETPLEFRPERWLAEATEGRHPFAFVPFSAGLRNCIGQKFAWMELKTHVAQVLRQLEFRAGQAEGDMEPALMFILRPERGVRLSLKPLSS